MRVLYIVDPGIVGGATLSFIEMIKFLKIKGIEAVVCTSTRNRLNSLLESFDVETHAVGHASVLEPISPFKWKRPIKYPLRWLNYRYKRGCAVKRIGKVIDMSKIDLIHTNSARNDIGCYLNKRYGIPHVMHFREFADLDFDCIDYCHGYIDIYNQYTTKFISISNAVMKHWIKKGLDPSLFVTIYNGIDYRRILKSLNEDKCNTHLKMVMTSGICEAKGQHLAIEAIAMLPEKLRAMLTLDIVGWCDPKYLSALHILIEKYQLKDRVTFVDSRSDIHQLLANYQVGLMCSRSEGFGRVTAEFMHARLGVIASDSGANRELIDDDRNGLLFISGDAKSLAQCMQKFLDDRNFLISCSECALQDAEARFTAERNADSILELYKKILYEI